MTYILYNDLAGDRNKKFDKTVLLNTEFYSGTFVNVTEVEHSSFFASLKDDDVLLVCGGDGTLNRFVNKIEGLDFKGEIYYLPSGTGNDFAKDTGHEKDKKPFCITRFLKKLPTITVNGKTYRFLNGVGLGLDGYCCEEVNKKKNEGKSKVNYIKIALKGLLYKFKPVNATVTVDGVTKNYKKVWMVPTMFGKFYGGGVMPAPDQDRESKKGTLSAMVVSGCNKYKCLFLFPTILKGTHVKHKKIINMIEGKQIKVCFDRPVSLQIDGETFLKVSSYTVNAYA